MTFTENDAYLVCGTSKDVRVWRVKDGEQVAMMPVEGSVLCVAVSRDGRWITAGSQSISGLTIKGEVIVWDTTTYEQVFAAQTLSTDIDFSSGSTHLISADYHLGTATVWDVAAHRKVRILNHGGFTYSARYSPQGDRIATAGPDSIKVWDSNDGRLLVDIKMVIHDLHCLFWCKNNLFVRTKDNKIRRIDAATGSAISEWPVPAAQRPHIALPPHGKFIVHVADEDITVWDTATHSQLNLIQCIDHVRSIAWSSDGRLLAIPSQGKVVIKELFPHVSVSSMPRLQSIFLHLSSRSQNLILTVLHSMHGNAVNSRMRKHYYPQQSQRRK